MPSDCYLTFTPPDVMAIYPILASVPLFLALALKLLSNPRGKDFRAHGTDLSDFPTQVLTNDKQVTVHTGKEISLNELIIITCHYRSLSSKYMRGIH